MTKKSPNPNQPVQMNDYEKRGYQPVNEGYQPTQGSIDVSNPPKGGSVVPPLPPKNTNN